MTFGNTQLKSSQKFSTTTVANIIHLKHFISFNTYNDPMGVCYYHFLTDEEIELERLCNSAKITWLG